MPGHQTTIQTSVVLNGYACIDPNSLYQTAQENNLPTDHWYGKPNSFYSPRGKTPGYGYVLLAKEQFDKLDLSYPHTLEFLWGTDAIFAKSGDNLSVNPKVQKVVITGLRIVKAVAVYAEGLAASNTTIYLLTLVDKRAEMFLSSTEKKYNVRSPTVIRKVSGTSDVSLPYYQETLKEAPTSPSDPKVLWGWNDIIEDLFTELPGNPNSPSFPEKEAEDPEDPDIPDVWKKEPEGFQFIGMSAWEAVNIVIESMNLCIWYDPIHGPEPDPPDPDDPPNPKEFVLIQMQKEDEAFDTLIGTEHEIIEYNIPIYVGSFIPEKVRVFFYKYLEDAFGSERDALVDTGNWIIKPWWSKDILTHDPEDPNLSFPDQSIEGTVLPLWDNHPAIYNYDLTLDNETDLEDRAEEIAKNYLQKIARKNSFYHARPGIHTDTLPNSQVFAIRWCDLGDAFGMTTELFGSQASWFDSIHSGTGPMREVIELNDSPRTIKDVTTSYETIYKPNIARKTFPNCFPRHLQLVKNVDMDLNSCYVLEGKVCRQDPQDGTYTAGEKCWLRPIDSITSLPEPLDDEYYFMGQQVGRMSCGTGDDEEIFPVYIIELRPCIE